MVRRVPILLALLFMLSCDSEAPTGPEAFEPVSGVADLGAFLIPKVLLLDEDAIGKGLEPNSFEEEDVNEEIAGIGRTNRSHVRPGWGANSSADTLSKRWLEVSLSRQPPRTPIR